MKTAFKRAAAAGASAALLATGMSVAVTNGVASAEGSSSGSSTTEGSSSCDATKVFKGGKINAEQTVSPAKAYPGQEVTYTTKISRASGGWNLKEVGIFAPEGFVLQGDGEVNVYTVGPGQTWYDANLSADSDKNLYWERANPADTWVMTSGHYAELKTTFTVPEDAEVGSTQQAGVQARPVGWDSQEWPTTGACLEIRDKNPIEQATGSLDDFGLGSVNTASQNGSASLTDPQGSITGIINNLDFGKIIGGAIGS